MDSRQPEPEDPGLGLLSTIGTGLQRVERFHLLALWLMGAPHVPQTSVELVDGHGHDAIQIWSDGHLIFEARPQDVDWREWDTKRYCELDQRVTERWREYNELFASEPKLSAEEKARVRARMQGLQEDLCRDFGDLVEMYQRALGQAGRLPTYETLNEVCHRSLKW